MRYITTILAALLLTGSITRAQSLEECRALAREHYPEIKKFGLINKAKEYNLSNAARAWIPQISLSGQATYQTATPTYPEAFSNIMAASGVEMTGIRKDQYRLAIDINQNIWDGGISNAERAKVEAEAAEQQSRLEVSLYDLETRIDDIYFGILLLQERVAQAETLTGILEENLEKMRAYHRNGTATQADVDAVEAELLTTKQSLEQAKSSKASYRRILELFIGKPLERERLERPALQEVTTRVSARPELDLFDSQERQANAQLKAINASLMPRFSAFAQGYYGYPGLDMFHSMRTTEWTLNAIVGVRMSWNIGAFYTRENNIGKLNTTKQQIALQRDIFLFNSRISVEQQDGEINRLKRAIEDDNRIVELRRSVRKAAESQLDNGVIDTTELLKKIAEETAAEQNRSTHEIELLQAIYRLKNTLNQ